MKKIIYLTKLIFLFYCLGIVKAYAYLDPGTGSIILQAIIAAIATAGATITYYWRKIKISIKNIFIKKNKKDLSEK